ncbi:hypothetical protein CB1_000875016 [Camelus ferus]|nr:hypothetical protein CB1_000875016 [Camelus ferus]
MRVTAFLDALHQNNLPPLTCLEKHAFSGHVFSRTPGQHCLFEFHISSHLFLKGKVGFRLQLFLLLRSQKCRVHKGLLDSFRGFSNNEEDFTMVMEIMVRLSENAGLFSWKKSTHCLTVATKVLSVPPPPTTHRVKVGKVRKSSQEVLWILLEQGLISQQDNENKVCPVLLAPSAPDSGDEQKAEAVNVCATNFDEICRTVGQEATEKFLVRQAAFLSLGPFISTFANPSRAGLYVQDDGVLGTDHRLQIWTLISPPSHPVQAAVEMCPQPGDSRGAGTHQLRHLLFSNARPLVEALMRSKCLASCPGCRPGHKQGLGAAPERAGAAGGRLPHTETVLGSGVASGRIQRVLGSSQEHVMHDPDVQVKKDIIPQPRLDQDVSMPDPARAQTVNTDRAKHHACSLLGVAGPGQAELALSERDVQNPGFPRAVCVCAVRSGRPNTTDFYEEEFSALNSFVEKGVTPDVFAMRVLLEDSEEMFRVTNCRSDMTVRELKEELDLMAGIPFNLQRLQFLDQDSFYQTANSQRFNNQQWKTWVSQRAFVALYIASHRGHVEVVQYLLEHGASCRGRTPVGRTPLHVAAAMGQLDCISLLLNHGASINARDAKGETPMSVARRLSGSQSERRMFLFYWMMKLGTKGLTDPTMNKGFQRVKTGFGSKKESKK